MIMTEATTVFVQVITCYSSQSKKPKEGFTGSGLECEDEDECKNSLYNHCSRYSSCQNTEGSYTCQCDEGYQETVPSFRMKYLECSIRTQKPDCKEMVANASLKEVVRWLRVHVVKMRSVLQRKMGILCARV